MNMTEPDTTAPRPPLTAPGGELLIKRDIVFRNSTFGGLKCFIREYRHRHRTVLSNAAAVDFILRDYLSRHLPREAVSEMQGLSRTEGWQAIGALPTEPSLDAAHGAALVPSEAGRNVLRVTPLESTAAPSTPVFTVRVSKLRQLIAEPLEPTAK